MTQTAAPARSTPALLAAIPAAVGVVVALTVAIVQYALIDGGQTKKLTGLDAFLGLPNVAISVILFALFLTWFIGLAAGALYNRALWLGAIVVAAIGAIYEVLAVILNFSPTAIVLVLAAIAVVLFTILGQRGATGDVPPVAMSDRPKAFGIVLVLAGLAGLTAAYNLSLDKVTVILSPGSGLNCNVSIVVQCGKNLGSWQGSLFGFPNPLIGLGGYAVVLLIGVATLTGVRYPRWWWVTFNIGVMGATAFICFLIYSSVFTIATLCLWCSLVWLVTIPTFWLVTIRNLKVGNLAVGPRATRFWSGAYSWTPIITLVCYAIIFLLFEVVLNLLARL
ncbi:MAG TPA: vitamin K epoxide reductase family protein [Galbitalea sp.]|nr:vitamin K epoxide reductase family protein [Galbitalea sp.]